MRMSLMKSGDNPIKGFFSRQELFVKKLQFPLMIFIISPIVFFLGVLLKLNYPIAEWDRVSLIVASDWARGINTAWLFDHPPGYPMILALIFKIFGLKGFSGKLA